MKKTRLLEIIREEITLAINEAGLFTLKNPEDAKKGLPQTTDPDDSTEKSPDFLRKYKKVAELADKYQLDEDIINEMAFALKKGIAPSEKIESRYKKENFKKVVDLILSKVDGKKTMADIARELGVIQQKIRPVVSDLLDVGILEKGEAESKAGKDTDNKPGPKAKEKPADEPKAKKEKEEKPAKEKPEPKSKAKSKDEEGDEEFEKLEKAEKEFYSSEEEPEQTEKAPVGDKGTEQKARKQDKVIKAYKEIESEMKDKIQKAKTGDKTAMDWLKEKQPIIKAYNALKKVGI